MTTSKPEVVARTLTWVGPRHMSVLHDGLCARTFNEFPIENEYHGFWKEGEPLIYLSDYEALQAECKKLREKLTALTGGLRF